MVSGSAALPPCLATNGMIGMKRFLSIAACLVALAGCAGSPDVTLLGAVGIADEPPQPAASVVVNAPAADAQATAIATSADTPSSVGPLAMAGPAAPKQGPLSLIEATASNPRPVPLHNVAATVDAAAAPSAAGTPPLKTEAQIRADQEELRRLASNAEEKRPGGLWSASVDFLSRLRSTHGEEAIEKIEAEQ